MKQWTLMCLLLLLVAGGKAQSVTASAGGDATVGNMQLSYTAGEAVIATIEGAGAVLTQGFHQPTYSVTALRETFPPGAVSVFPNPTAAWLTVQFKDVELENILIFLFDLGGRTMLTAGATTDLTQIDLSGLAGGFYLLTVTDKTNAKTNSFKILKSN